MNNDSHRSLTTTKWFAAALALMALALAGSAWAASPYDLPYGIQ